MTLAFVAGTLARLADTQVRRLCCAGFVIAHGFLFLGWALHALAANLWAGEFVQRNGGFLLFFVIGWPGWFVFSGLGPGADRLITRWLGEPPLGPETQTRARERQIRDAASQEERHRLARDLHDSIKQEIFSIHTSAATAQARFDGDAAGAKRALEQVRDSARDAMTEMEAMLDRLHAAPLENTGLEAALRKQCEALSLRSGAEVTCQIKDLPPSAALAPGAHEALFRIAQEALSNIARHARATHVQLELAMDGPRLELAIHDDGAGFDQGSDGSRAGMGITNMRARAREAGATFSMTSEPGRGATVRAYLVVFPVASDFWRRHPRRKWIFLVLVSPVLIALVLFFVQLVHDPTHLLGLVGDHPERDLGDVAFLIGAAGLLWTIEYLGTRRKFKKPTAPR
jgi:two-component sensor histidine kinase